jgi:hypothetical protein
LASGFTTSAGGAPGSKPAERRREALRGGDQGPTRQAAARLTGFEDSNSSTNLGIDSNAASQRTILSNIDENLALLNNGSNGDPVPATVPESELVPLTRQRVNIGIVLIVIGRSPPCNPAFRGSLPTVRGRVAA